MSDRQDQFKSGVSNTHLEIINEENPQLLTEKNNDDDLTSTHSSISSRLNQGVSHINNRNNSNSVLSDLNSSLSSLNSGGAGAGSGLDDDSQIINHLSSNNNPNILQINNNSNNFKNHRRNISDSSFASFLQSNSGTVIGSPGLNSNSISNFNQDLSIGMSPDDSNLSIGFNNISEKTVSPLGQNSIYELVYSSDKNRKTSTGLLTAQSGNALNHPNLNLI
ncbi:unnamed protein product [[Candida] boidinii]|nr:unnamed protein product [[Candida] boidinii]